MKFRVDKKLESSLKEHYNAKIAGEEITGCFEGNIRMNGNVFSIWGYIGTRYTSNVVINVRKICCDGNQFAPNIKYTFNSDSDFESFKKSVAFMIAYTFNMI